MNPSRRRVWPRVLSSLALVAVMGGVGALSLTGQPSTPVRAASLPTTGPYLSPPEVFGIDPAGVPYPKTIAPFLRENSWSSPRPEAWPPWP